MSSNTKVVADLIATALEGKPDEYEVAIYIAARHALMQSAEAGISSPNASIQISPESLRLVASYDLGLTDNEFYMSNWSALRAFMEMDDIETHTKSFHLRRAEETDATDSKRVVRDLVSPRFTALTFVVARAKGRKAAEEFDFELKRLTTISDAQVAFFRNAGD